MSDRIAACKGILGAYLAASAGFIIYSRARAGGSRFQSLVLYFFKRKAVSDRITACKGVLGAYRAASAGLVIYSRACAGGSRFQSLVLYSFNCKSVSRNRALCRRTDLTRFGSGAGSFIPVMTESFYSRSFGFSALRTLAFLSTRLSAGCICCCRPVAPLVRTLLILTA